MTLLRLSGRQDAIDKLGSPGIPLADRNSSNRRVLIDAKWCPYSARECCRIGPAVRRVAERGSVGRQADELGASAGPAELRADDREQQLTVPGRVIYAST